MVCPICGRVYCDHSPSERGQTQEEMIRDMMKDAQKVKEKTVTKSSLTKKRNPFRMNLHPRFNFKDWVNAEFPELRGYSLGSKEYKDLVERIDEVHEAALTVLELTMRNSGEPIKKYYADDLNNLRAAYQARDYKIYAKHLATLVDAIEVE